MGHPERKARPDHPSLGGRAETTGEWVSLREGNFYNLWVKISLFRNLGSKQNDGDSSHTGFKILMPPPHTHTHPRASGHSDPGPAGEGARDQVRSDADVYREQGGWRGTNTEETWLVEQHPASPTVICLQQITQKPKTHKPRMGAPLRCPTCLSQAAGAGDVHDPVGRKPLSPARLLIPSD